MVREQIFTAIIGSDKTKPHVIVKLFNCASCHVISSLLKNQRGSLRVIYVAVTSIGVLFDFDVFAVLVHCVDIRFGGQPVRQ